MVRELHADHALGDIALDKTARSALDEMQAVVSCWGERHLCLGLGVGHRTCQSCICPSSLGRVLQRRVLHWTLAGCPPSPATFPVPINILGIA